MVFGEPASQPATWPASQEPVKNGWLAGPDCHWLAGSLAEWPSAGPPPNFPEKQKKKTTAKFRKKHVFIAIYMLFALSAHQKY